MTHNASSVELHKEGTCVFTLSLAIFHPHLHSSCKILLYSNENKSIRASDEKQKIDRPRVKLCVFLSSVDLHTLYR